MKEKTVPILKILYKSWLWIVLFTILCTLVGLFYSVSQVPPTYTATRSLILRTEIHDTESSYQSANQANLAKNYFYTVEKLIKSPKLVKEVNENNADIGLSVESSAIGISYGENSLIFKVSYTAKTKELAEQKLNAIIDTFSKSNTIKEGIMASDVQFIHTQKGCDTVENNSHVKITVIGGVIGLVLSVGAAFVVYLLDNTVRDRQEFEEITVVNVIAYINKEKTKKKK